MSAFWNALHFLRPHWLWALLALPLLAWWWRVQRHRLNAWQGHVDAHLLSHLLVRSGGAARAGMTVAALAYALAVLALAGPSWRQGDQPLWQAQRPLVVVLDLSSRISTTDLPPSRLLQARAKLARLLDARAGSPVALVAFADDAFTVAPMTDDAANIRTRTKVVDGKGYVFAYNYTNKSTPVTFTNGYRKMPGYKMVEFVCENNREYVDDQGRVRMRLGGR